MSWMAFVLVALVAALHVWFLVLEMFLWNTPFGHKALRMKKEQAEATEVLAKNQGLYNGFIAAGIIWGLVAGPPLAVPVVTFFLICVIVAGVYGAATASKMILFLQAVPGAAALGALMAFGLPG